MFVILILDIFGRLVPGKQTHYKGGSFSHELLVWSLVYLIPTGIGLYELGITRPTIYRYVGPDGKLREYGKRVLQTNQKVTC